MTVPQAQTTINLITHTGVKTSWGVTESFDRITVQLADGARWIVLHTATGRRVTLNTRMIESVTERGR